MSFADVVEHLIEADEWLVRQLARIPQRPLRGRVSDPLSRGSDPRWFTRRLEALEESGRHRSALLRELTERDLDAQIDDERFGGAVSAWWVIVRGNLDHEIHHRGQIAAALAQVECLAQPEPRPHLQGILDCVVYNDGLATAGQPTVDQLAAVAHAGYRQVINLLHPSSDAYLPDEEAVVRRLGMGYHHIPVDWEAPRREDVETFFAAMDEYARQPVFVHCAKNMRVSAFVALYRIRRLGWERRCALRGIYRIWTPDDTWQRLIDAVLEDG